VAAQLKVDAMTTQGKLNYEAQLKNLAISHSMLETATLEGRLEGEKDGELKKGKYADQKLILRGFANEDIADIAGLSVDLIEELRKEMN
jgi:predicted transposase YdaD